ncbi:unnamed protein product [Psylliodes chrysocephalus]|uniref:Mff-like domain-containing protein n=1 Tax=Psylliodes chrysocephalus TaxID=3402493 RepID=A0A9P0CUM9_9CUCU|nr:unnamed protein product [Psylliodes chrysocephala]
MDVVVNAINIIRSRGLNHRQFKAFLDELSSEHDDVTYYCDVRWLRKGTMLKKIYDLRKEIDDFMEMTEKTLPQICDPTWRCDLAFLVDITGHLNDLKLKLQKTSTIGTRAPPREIVFDNSILTSDPYPYDLPRVATPPRTLTLDKYPFPGVEDYEDPEVENERLPVAKKQPLKFHMNDVSFQVNSSQLNDTGSHLYGASGEGLTPAEEVLHLRRQMAKLNRRIMALELETMSRLQKEKIVVGFGIAYFLLKVIIWMNRD